MLSRVYWRNGASKRGTLYGILEIRGRVGQKGESVKVRGRSAAGRGCGGCIHWSRDSGDAVA